MTAIEIRHTGGGSKGRAGCLLPDQDAIPSVASRETDVLWSPHVGKQQAVAILTVGLAAGAAIVVLPGVLSVLVASGVATTPQASRIGAFELAGIAIFVFGSGFLLNRFDRRAVALVSVLAIAVLQLISAWSQSVDSLCITRLFLGLAEGSLIATITAAIASSTHPERLFGLWFSLNLIVSASFYAALPILMSVGRGKAVMSALAGLAVVAGSGLPWFPHPDAWSSKTAVSAPATRTADILSIPTILAMSASLALFIGIGAVWPLMGQIGQAHNVGINVVTGALSAASVAGVVSGLIVSWLGVRVGRTIPLIIGTLGLSTAMILLLPTSADIFVLAAVSFMAWWICNGTYYLGVLSVLDRSGRLTAITFGMQFLGLTVGQFLSAFLLRAGSYRQLIVVSASLSLLALGLVTLTVRSRGYREAARL